MREVIKISKEANYRFASYTDIIKFQDMCLQHPSQHLIINFENCVFISPVAITILASLIELGKYSNKIIEFDWTTVSNSKVRNFLFQLGSVEAFNKMELNDRETLMKRFQVEDLEDSSLIVDYIEQVTKLIPVTLSEDERGKIISIVYEIFVNALHHSESQGGVYACGYYSSQKDMLSFCIYDMGVGIPMKVRKFFDSKKMSSTEALKWASGKGNTTVINRDYARGLGFTQLTDFIIDNGGNLKIVSLDSQCDIKGQNLTYRCNILPLVGTLFSMEIKNKPI